MDDSKMEESSDSSDTSTNSSDSPRRDISEENHAYAVKKTQSKSLEYFDLDVRKADSRKHRSRSRSNSRGRSKRSRSTSKSRGRNKRRSRSRSRRRSRTRSKSRRRSISRSRRKRSRSKSRQRRRSRSGSRSKPSRGQHRRRSRSRSRSHTRTKSSRKNKRSPSPISKEKRSPDSFDSLRDKATRKRLLEVAKKNAVYLMKNNCLPPSIEKESVQATGKSVEELTSFCKQLVAKDYSDGELSNASLSADEPDSPSESPFAEGRHPFAVKDNKPIMMNIRNAPMISTKTNAERLADASKLREQFPVSSGTQHRNVAENEWVPVEKSDSGIDSATVFPDCSKTNLDISRLVSTRMDAMRKLQSNPTDKEAMKALNAAQKEMTNWALSKQVPGQFTGSTGAKILSQEELASGYQPWVKKEQFRKADPVRSHFGLKMLQKMGWNPGEGLGKNKEGQIEPLVIDVKIDKKGLSSHNEITPRKASVPLNKCLSGKHPVTALAEICTKNKWRAPVYETVFDYGPVHKKNFLVQVIVNNQTYKPANFTSSKKIAKANAAAAALQALGLLKDPHAPIPKGTLTTSSQANETPTPTPNQTQTQDQDQPQSQTQSQTKTPLLPPPASAQNAAKQPQSSSQNNFQASMPQYSSSTQSSNTSHYSYTSGESYQNNSQSQGYQNVGHSQGYQNSNQTQNYQGSGYQNSTQIQGYQEGGQYSSPSQESYQNNLQATYSSNYPEGYQNDQASLSQYTGNTQEGYNYQTAVPQYTSDTPEGYQTMLASYSQSQAALYNTPQTSTSEPQSSSAGERKSSQSSEQPKQTKPTQSEATATSATSTQASYSNPYSVDPQSGYSQIASAYGAAAAAANPYATSAYYEQLQQYYSGVYQGQQY